MRPMLNPLGMTDVRKHVARAVSAMRGHVTLKARV